MSVNATLSPRTQGSAPAAPGAWNPGAGVRWLIEGVVLVLVVLAPWAFGCLPPVYQSLLILGVAVLLALWAVRMLLERRLIWVTCPLSLCLAGLFLLGIWQIAPLPRSLLEYVSPGTVALLRPLLPDRPDQLPDGRTAEPPQLAAGSSISLYPAGTQAVSLQFLALFAFYAVVRSNLAAPAALRRLAVVAVVNGCLLSLFGLLQFFSSPRGFVYWVVPTEAPVFGPVNRNAFAAYINLCIGLGLGLLLSAAGPALENSRRFGRVNPFTLLSKPAVLWTGAALALMIGALALTLSRGGVLAFLAASGVCAALTLVPAARQRTSAMLPAVLVIAAGLGLVFWLGYDRVEARLRTLAAKETYEDGRAQVWQRTLPWVKTFPVWGAGYGTFPYLEQLRREPNAGIDYFWDDAHNNYLQLLLEGGVLGLALGLTAVGAAFYLAVRAFLRPASPQAGALAAGALFALTTLTLHSFLDFGLHIPATAVLATVLCAHLGSLSHRDSFGDVATASTPLLGRVMGCLVGATGVAAVALILWQQGRTEWLTGRYRGAARAYTASEDTVGQERRRAYLEAGVAASPQDADLQLALADAYYDVYLRQTREAEREALSAAVLGEIGPIGRLRERQQRLREELLVPALRGYLLARNLCPLLDRPHVRLAAHTDALERTDPVAVHLARTRLVVPYSAQIWYLSGLHELERAGEAGDHEDVWADWRRSLECSSEHLPEIVRRSRRYLKADALAERVIPDDPVLLNDAGHLLEDGGDDGGPLYAAALAALERPGAAQTTAALLLKARLHHRFGHADEARRAYEDLLTTPGQDAGYRLEYARVLFEQGRFEDSRRELSVLLDLQPGNSEARELFHKVLQRLTEGG